ncbi:hypothetical protein LD110_03505 [Arthrobacter sp. M4]|nr:hypothetical protein [Arthrobacter sp. M4]
MAMRWNQDYPWIQIHTADKETPAPNRLGLTTEPMTYPPDAVNSGIDLVILAPGQEHHACWRIQALD